MFTYADRNKTLQEMGCKTYKDYLNSDLWKDIRVRAFAFHGHKCYLCRKQATALHHTSYKKDVLLGKLLDKIIPICDGCHKKVEFKTNGDKRTLVEVGKAFNYFVKEAKVKIKGVTETKDAGQKYPRYFGLGRCEKCGAKAKKKTRYCRPCTKPQ